MRRGVSSDRRPAPACRRRHGARHGIDRTPLVDRRSAMTFSTAAVFAPQRVPFCPRLYREAVLGHAGFGDVEVSPVTSRSRSGASYRLRGCLTPSMGARPGGAASYGWCSASCRSGTSGRGGPLVGETTPSIRRLAIIPARAIRRHREQPRSNAVRVPRIKSADRQPRSMGRVLYNASSCTGETLGAVDSPAVNAKHRNGLDPEERAARSCPARTGEGDLDVDNAASAQLDRP